jgi:hypothetical protein
VKRNFNEQYGVAGPNGFFGKTRLHEIVVWQCQITKENNLKKKLAHFLM